MNYIVKVANKAYFVPQLHLLIKIYDQLESYSFPWSLHIDISHVMNLPSSSPYYMFICGLQCH